VTAGFIRSLHAIAVSVGLLLATSSGLAQTRYPAQPIKVIMAVAPGASSDLAMRVIGEAMSRQLGQALVLDNRPGAGGVLAAAALSKAPADGYTIGLITNSHLINPAVIKNLPFDTLQDFAPITLLTQGGMVLLANPSLRVETFPELVALAKKRPNQITYGSSGVGSLLHLYTAQIEHDAGIELRHIPYKGLTPMVQDLVGGLVEVGMAALPATTAFIESGKLKPLAVTSKTRMPSLPNVPTLAEAGLAGYDNNGWMILVGPKALPREVAVRLRTAAKAALAEPKVMEALAKSSMNPVGATPEETARVLQTDMQKYMSTARRIGLKPE
jgi:tripartite-type tricarboxylate transporter receptor subunit TctC